MVMSMKWTENVQELPCSTKSALAKETNPEAIANIDKLIADGYRLYLSKEFESAAEKLGEANQAAVELYGQFAPECFKPHYYYGLTMLEIARNEAQIVEPPVEDLEEVEDEEDEGDKEDKEEDGQAQTNVEDKSAKETEEETNDVQSDKATANDTDVQEQENIAEETLNDNDKENPKEDDEEEPSSEAIAWESLEVARKICENLETNSSEWTERKADVLVALSDCMIISEQYDTALADLETALLLQKQLFKPHDRRIAETYYHIGLCHRNSDMFEKAAMAFQEAGRQLQSLISDINEQGEAATAEERETVKSLADVVKEVEEAAQDALDSAQAREKQLAEQREVVQNVLKKVLTNGDAADDITSMLKHRGVKRPAVSSEGDSSVNGTTAVNGVAAAVPTNDAGLAQTTSTTTDAEADAQPTKTTDIHTGKEIEMEEPTNGTDSMNGVSTGPKGKKPKLDDN